jgi:uncharacterized integral membrane protein (TIGR00697 family)
MKLISKENVLLFLFGLYIVLFLLANILSVKIVNFYFFETSFSIILVPILFLITDIVCEVYGFEKSKFLVFTSTIFLIISFLVIYLFLNLPFGGRIIANPESLNNVFGNSFRIFLASVIAFFLAQLNDIYIFSKLKKLTKGKKLWLRNNISTIISQFIDSLVFLLIAFLYINPTFTFSFIFFKMFIPYYLIKVLLALFDTPFVYLFVKLIKKLK